MIEKKPDKYKRISWEVFKVAAGICLLVFLLINFSMVKDAVGKVFTVLTPIWMGVILCFLANPLYAFLRKLFEKKTGTSWAKVIATVVTTIAVVAVIYGLFALILPQISDSVMTLIQQAPGYIEKLGVFLEDFGMKHPEWKDTIEKAYTSVTGYLENFVDTAVVPNLTSIAASVFTSVKSFAVQMYNLLIGIVAMVYLLNVKETILPKLKKLLFAFLKKETAETFCDDMKKFVKIFGGYIAGKLLDSLIIGVLCFIFMSVMKMPYTLLISVIIGVTNIIPFLGPFIGAIPSSLLIILIDPKMGLIFIVFILILQQLDGNVIGPKILGQSTGVSSFWVLVSVILFGGLFGAVGMVFAIPIWAILTGLINRYAEKHLQQKGLPLEDSAYAPGKKVEAVSKREADETIEQ